MTIWTVFVSGDAETFSAWITEALAWADAEALAMRLCARAAAADAKETRWVCDPDQNRVRCERSIYADLDGQPMWAMFKGIFITELEVQGDAVAALAKVVG